MTSIFQVLAFFKSVVIFEFYVFIEIRTNCDHFRIVGTNAPFDGYNLTLHTSRPLAHRLQVPLQIIKDVAGNEDQTGQLT